MLKVVWIFILLIIPFYSYSQSNNTNVYWVGFKYKTTEKYTLEDPQQYLSERSLKRRQTQHISIDSTDLPVSEQYKLDILNLGVSVLGESKWLNGVLIRDVDSILIPSIKEKYFVDTVSLVYKQLEKKSALVKKDSLDIKAVKPANTYEVSRQQLKFHGVDYLHDLGFRGAGISIAVIDGGFINVDVLPVFKKMYDEKRLLASKDYVSDLNVYTASGHGTRVLSLMAGFQENVYTGFAPLANYMLFKTEDVFSEFPIEEIYWAMSAEMADSLGTDIINSSLGYFQFDDSTLNYTYAKLIDQETYIAKAANLASEKGIFVVTSAGNLGGSSWYYLSSPGEAEKILTVGAVDITNNIAGFSSKGFEELSYIKPEVVALGANALVCHTTGEYSTGSGTSFSSPITAGFAACLWQAYPKSSVQDIKEAIIVSADKYDIQDNIYGYGLPNLVKAFDYLKQRSMFAIDNLTVKIGVFVNPYNTSEINLFIYGPIEPPMIVDFYSLSGSKVYTRIIENIDSRSIIKFSSFHQHQEIFIVKVTGANTSAVTKFYMP